jgi:cystathionine beta-lyase
MNKTKKSNQILNATNFIHSPNLSLYENRFVNPPIYRGSTIFFKDYDEMMSGCSQYIYGRWGTPTSDYFCKAITELEDGFAAIATCSGLSAITTCILSLIAPGGHIIINQSAYPGVFRFLIELQTKMSFEIEIISVEQAINIDKHIKSTTQFVYWDMPGSYGADIINIQCIKNVIGEIPLIVDNTWATPLFFNPLRLGADVVIHSTSKYIAGHSDSIMGCIVFKEEKIYANVLKMSRALGQYASADDLTLASRGLKTLAIRMHQHYENALHVANWLSSQKAVEKVFYPPLKSDKSYELWQAQFSGGGGLLTFVLTHKHKDKIASLLNQFQLIRLGWGWGGYESLASSMLINLDEYENYPVIRLSIGLEDIADIVYDLANAFAILE